MNKEFCEKVRISAMAISDGEQAQLPEKEISQHISACEGCRTVIEQLQITVNLLNSRQRKFYEINVLSAVEAALSDVKMAPKKSDYSAYFIMLGLALFILKIIVLSPVAATGIIARLLTIIVIIIFFVLIKQNPFTIKENLQMKGEIKC